MESLSLEILRSWLNSYALSIRLDLLWLGSYRKPPPKVQPKLFCDSVLCLIIAKCVLQFSPFFFPSSVSDIVWNSSGWGEGLFERNNVIGKILPSLEEESWSSCFRILTIRCIFVLSQKVLSSDCDMPGFIFDFWDISKTSSFL